MLVKRFGFAFLAFFLFTGCKSGLITTSNACYNLLTQADASLREKNFTKALEEYSRVLDNCKAYDARERGYAGKAAALNGLAQYDAALNAANEGLATNKNSVENYFQKANAELGLKQVANAQADFNTVIDLTSKNRNVKERATIYAKMAEINLQQKMYEDAMNNLQQAIALDASNPDFYMLQGDVQVATGKFEEAAKYYDMAISHGKNDAEVWKAKAANTINYYQKKYNTMDAHQLASRMNATEKQQLCTLINNATTNGVKDMNMDLLKLAVCP